MLTQHLAQKQRLKILPQQIQLLNFFHLNTLELEQRIQMECEENPLLEDNKTEGEDLNDKYNKDSIQDFQDWEERGYDDIPDYKTEYNNYLSEDRMPEQPIPAEFDFRKAAKEQYKIGCTDDRACELAEYLIDSLNDSGLMELTVQELSDDYSFRHHRWIEPEEIEAVLKGIQELDPVGLGARSVRECMQLQLERMNGKRPDVKMATRLLADHFGDLQNRNMDKIRHGLGIDEDDLKIVLSLLASLKMKPVYEEFSGVKTNLSILPDFVVIQTGEDLEIQLYRNRSENLHINSSWKEMAQSNPSLHTDKSAMQYMKNKLQSAQWFISAVQQREATMLRIMRSIVTMQRDYFLTGDVNTLKPMILKNIAEIVGVDISTVSRITCNKYVETSFGLLLLKDLFTEGIANEKGEVISNRVIQSAIQEVIEGEDKTKPFTDQQLVTLLSERGFLVARRTVAKYREQMQIPVSHVRGLWA